MRLQASLFPYVRMWHADKNLVKARVTTEELTQGRHAGAHSLHYPDDKKKNTTQYYGYTQRDISVFYQRQPHLLTYLYHQGSVSFPSVVSFMPPSKKKGKKTKKLNWAKTIFFPAPKIDFASKSSEP